MPKQDRYDPDSGPFGVLRSRSSPSTGTKLISLEAPTTFYLGNDQSYNNQSVQTSFRDPLTSDLPRLPVSMTIMAPDPLALAFSER